MSCEIRTTVVPSRWRRRTISMVRRHSAWGEAGRRLVEHQQARTSATTLARAMRWRSARAAVRGFFLRVQGKVRQRPLQPAGGLDLVPDVQAEPEEELLAHGGTAELAVRVLEEEAHAAGERAHARPARVQAVDEDLALRRGG